MGMIGEDGPVFLARPDGTYSTPSAFSFTQELRSKTTHLIQTWRQFSDSGIELPHLDDSLIEAIRSNDPQALNIAEETTVFMVSGPELVKALGDTNDFTMAGMVVIYLKQYYELRELILTEIMSFSLHT